MTEVRTMTSSSSSDSKTSGTSGKSFILMNLNNKTMKTVIHNPSSKIMEYLLKEGIPYTLKNNVLVYDGAKHKPYTLKFNQDPEDVNFNSKLNDHDNQTKTGDNP